jgi:hypothetical protein
MLFVWWCIQGVGDQPEDLDTYSEKNWKSHGGFSTVVKLVAAQELGKESVEKAFTSIQRLPSYLKQISEGFGNQAALTVLGARSAVDAMNQTLASYPRMSFAMTPFRAEKYLG